MLSRRLSNLRLILYSWDSAEYLQTEEQIAAYLDACFEEAGDDAAFIAKALGNVARARGMSPQAMQYTRF